MVTETKEITKAEETPLAASTDSTTPSAPTIESLQSRIDESNKLIADLQSQVKGRSKENAKLKQAVDDRNALKSELKDEIAQIVSDRISALGDVLFPDEESDLQQPPSKKQLLQSRLKPPEKKAPPTDESSSRIYEESMKYSGRIDGLLEDTGVKMDELPEDVVEEAQSKWKGGDFKTSFTELKKGINDYLKTKNEKAQLKEAEVKKENEKKALLVSNEKVPSSGMPTSNSIEALRAKLRSSQYLSPEEYRRLDENNIQRLKELSTKGSL